MTPEGETKNLTDQDLNGKTEDREEEWKRYNQEKRERLKRTDFTIIASNCCGTFMYYDMGLPYLSPTVNLSMSMGDFVKLAESLPWYMAQEFVPSKEEGKYPSGLLGDIKIDFVHYDTYEEGAAKWEERKKRINWDNLFFVGVEKDGCTYELIRRFDQLPYKHKVIFTKKEYPEFSSAYYIRGFEDRDELGVITFFREQPLKRRYLDDFDYAAFLNGEWKAGEKRSGFKQGRVSVVTPVYNGESHLASMLDSVLRQTYPHVDMTLVDDGSMDRTVEIAEGYREKFAARGYGYRIIRSFHKNASGAINQGLPYVGGEYLIWPDSDDVLEPESVEKRVEFLKAHPEYQCVRSQSYYFDQETGVTDRADEKTGDLSKEDLFWDILESKTYVCCGCYMLKSEAFFAIYPDRAIPEYPVGQNFQMLLPFMYFHSCPTIRKQLYGVCLREGSHSRTPLSQEQEEKKYQDYEKLVDEIAEICRIDDRASKQRLMCWKVKRRYGLALKYGKKKEKRQALFQLLKCGKSGRQAVKGYAKTLWSRDWLRKKKTWLYWRYRECYGKIRMTYRRTCEKTSGWLQRKKTWLYWRFREKYARLKTWWRRLRKGGKS